MKQIKSFIVLFLCCFTAHVMWGQCTNANTFTYSGANGAITIGNLPNAIISVDNIVTPTWVTVMAAKTYTVTNKTLTIPIAAGTYQIKFNGNISPTNTWCATTWKNVVVTAATACPAPTITLATPPATTLNTTTTLTTTPLAGTSQTITKVDFFSNGTTLLGTATTLPYSFAWKPTVTGTYSITAKITNSCGNTATSTAVSVTPTCPAPTITLAMPPASVIGTPILFTVTPNAGTSQTISKIEYYNSATLIGTTVSSPYSFGWTPAAAGTYPITAKITNSCGGVATSNVVSIVIPVACPVPTVTLSPVSGVVLNTAVTLTVIPNAGASRTVTKVEYFNSTTSLGTSTTAPYSFAWKPTAAGTYSVTAKVTNNCGSVGTSNAVSVTPTCPAPSITLAAPATTGNLNAPMTLTVTTNGGTSQSISKVEYCINGATTPNFTATTSPYAYTWTPNTAGVYSIVAKITNGCGSTMTSNAVSINVPTAGLCSNIYSNCSTGQLALGLNNFGSDKSYLLFVQGGIKAQKIKVELAATTWPDYVFAPTYQLMPLNKVAEFIQTNHHLPNMPSAKTLEKDGVDVVEIIKKQQEKIEELYLHIIELEKMIKNKN